MSSWAERFGKLTVKQALELNEATVEIERRKEAIDSKK